MKGVAILRPSFLGSWGVGLGTRLDIPLRVRGPSQGGSSGTLRTAHHHAPSALGCSLESSPSPTKMMS